MTSLPEERFVMKEENPTQWIDKGLYFFSWEKTRKKGTEGKMGPGPIYLAPFIHRGKSNVFWSHIA